MNILTDATPKMAALFGIFLGLLPGCVYRFTNTHISLPEGIQTIAVEAIYDTSREVLPHEILWISMQNAFAMDGNVRLAPQSQADAIVRLHLREAAVVPSGSTIENKPLKDPSLLPKETPPSPKDFRVLSQAGEIKEGASISMSVDVEVWNLKTRNLLLKKNYDLAGTFRAVHAPSPRSAVTTPENDYLRYEESLSEKFKSLSEDLARKVLQDLFIN